MELHSGCFHGKNVIITGASRGLGRAVAEAFWKRGANLLLVSRTVEYFPDLRDRFLLEAADEQTVHCFAADLACADAPARIMEEAGRCFERLDVLVNNAAILGPIGVCWDNDWELWQKTLQVNLLAPIDLCRRAIPWMGKNGGGSIVNLSGGGATGPRPNFSAYATAKAGLVRFGEILAREAAPFGIRVNSVAPGAMNTEMNEAVLRAGAESAGAEEFSRASRQAREGGSSPDAAAELIAFLASPAAAGITGRLISAQWDPWKELPNRAPELQGSDIYTLRRIVPEDRGRKWQ